MPSCSLSISISFSSKSEMRSWLGVSNMNVTVSPWSSACKANRLSEWGHSCHLLCRDMSARCLPDSKCPPTKSRKLRFYSCQTLSWPPCLVYTSLMSTFLQTRMIHNFITAGWGKKQRSMKDRPSWWWCHHYWHSWAFWPCFSGSCPWTGCDRIGSARSHLSAAWGRPERHG